MKRVYITVIAIISLATAIAQWQGSLPASVQLFLNDSKEQHFTPSTLLNGVNESMLTPYAPPYIQDGVEMVDAFIDIANPGVIESLKTHGVIVNCEFDGFVTAQIPVSMLETVSNINGVTDVEISKIMEFCTDSTLSVTHAGQVLNGMQYGLPQAYDGTGVIIGVIDTGFDYQHLTYKQADNDSITRIVRVYDPEDTTGHPAIVGTSTLRGSIFMGEQIDTLTTDALGATHGTHTSSIAAGKHVDCYSGMAPGSEIVLCSSRTLNVGISETQVANCIKYIFAYADSVGKPCVISVSVSTSNGPHDGKDKISKAVAQNVGPGRIFVVSAGNTGSSSVYCYGPSTLYKPFNMLIGFDYPDCDESYYYRYTWLDTWVRTKGARPIVKFHILDKIDKRIVWESQQINLTTTIDASEFSDFYEPDFSKDTVGYLYAMVALATGVGKYEIVSKINNLRSKASYYDPVQGKTCSRYQIGISVYPPKVMYPTQTDSCYIDSWICTSQGILSNYNSVVYMDSITEQGDTIPYPVSDYYAIPNNRCSIGTYAVSDSVISAGAYVARRSHYSLNEDRMIYDYTTSLHDAPKFSSFELEGYGPTGQALPTISAPGLFVIAAGSRYSYFNWNISQLDLVMRKNGFPWGAMTGTSMAAPTVAGIIAQWLQINPNLSPGDIKRIFAETAIKDEFTSGARFGPYGKIDAMAGAKYLLGINGDVEMMKGDLNNDGFVNITDVTLMINYLLTDDATGINLFAANINDDEFININDLTWLIDILLTQEDMDL
ncbi:MAG: S8 family serine peptidase [Muribaculaceae bacterium]|nr:S8 family serine peptidase [Muribaculaceae bacterium]